MNLHSHPVAFVQGKYFAWPRPRPAETPSDAHGSDPSLRERIGCLATSLKCVGVEGGEIVAVMDWDSHRKRALYTQCSNLLAP